MPISDTATEDPTYWARREALGSLRAEQEAEGVLKPIAQSEAAGVFWSAYTEGRRFRVVRQGASLIHGSYGVRGGQVPLSVGTVITLGRWLSDMDGNIDLIWDAIDGQPITGILGNEPHQNPWASFSPFCHISYMARCSNDVFGLPNPEQVQAPDPSFLQPVDEAGNPQPW